MQITSPDALSIGGAFALEQPVNTTIAPATGFEMVMSATLKTVSKSSQRVYHQTYRLWCDWCESAGVDPLDRAAMIDGGQEVGLLDQLLPQTHKAVCHHVGDVHFDIAIVTHQPVDVRCQRVPDLSKVISPPQDVG